MSFPRYPSYKHSGVEWLGQVPERWEVKPLKRACHVFPSNVDKKSYDGETAVRLCNYTDVYYNDTITAGMEFMAATASSEQIAKFTLRAGDTIITKDSETADDIAIGAYVPADLPGVICGYHLSMVRPMPGTCGAFTKRLFDSIYAKSCFAVLANGLTRVGLGQYELDNVKLPFPPIAEQHAIAAFLDRETGKIDELVAQQRRLMELLKEKRQAVISHAVTRGLNPAAPLKPTGIEWLGDVPTHWRVGKCGFYLKILSGFAFPSSGFSEDERNTKLLRGINVGVSRLKWDETVFWQRVPADGFDVYEMRAGDLVIGMDRPMIAEGMRVAKVKESDLPCLLLQRVPHISPEQIYNFVIPVPPICEQNEIADFISDEAAQFDALIAEAQRAIDLLQERRTALISAAVTGQIDVRNA